jgi:MSHA biogenesis protein MshP
MSKHQQGFSLITAIFLMVVAAGLIAALVNSQVVQFSTVTMSVLGARATQAARSGIEYGVYRALGSGTCNASETLNFTAAEPALEPFTVTLNCSSSAHTEGSGPNSSFVVYQLTALAEFGSYGSGTRSNPDYVSRRLRVTVSNAPP